MLVVSGQVRRDTALYKNGLIGRLRQLGDQEADILSMVRGITKYSAMIDDPQSIRYHLERAMHLAVTGRPGPCWIDVPVDVQGSSIDVESLSGYDPAEDAVQVEQANLAKQCREIVERIQAAERPVVMVGSGVRVGHAEEAFFRMIDRLGIPVTTAWTAVDLVPSSHPLYAGRPGTIGDRGGNFAVQNADFVLIIGSRLNIRQVSYNWKSFARHAFKVQVDIDPEELQKPTVRPDMGVVSDAAVFCDALCDAMGQCGYAKGKHDSWVSWCRERVAKYPALLARHSEGQGVLNPYHFINALLRRLQPDDVIVCANGTPSIIVCQVAEVLGRQRILCNSGCASMGFDLPAAIGAAIARGGKRVICFAGDGSLQMNIQEFQTVSHHQWPIKVFVLNNGGYASIRQTQKSFFGRFVGESAKSGVSFPDFTRVGAAYDIPSSRINGRDFSGTVDEVLQSPGPSLCEVVLDPEQPFEPKTSSKRLPDGRLVSAPLEDMWPFLDREEFQSNMLVPCEEF
jgi:acetolactate synthase-1/2/3 large subunit